MVCDCRERSNWRVRFCNVPSSVCHSTYEHARYPIEMIFCVCSHQTVEPVGLEHCRPSNRPREKPEGMRCRYQMVAIVESQQDLLQGNLSALALAKMECEQNVPDAKQRWNLKKHCVWMKLEGSRTSADAAGPVANSRCPKVRAGSLKASRRGASCHHLHLVAYYWRSHSFDSSSFKNAPAEGSRTLSRVHPKY